MNITAAEAKKRTEWALRGGYVAEDVMKAIMDAISANSQKGHNAVSYDMAELAETHAALVIERLTELGYKVHRERDTLEVSW